MAFGVVQWAVSLIIFLTVIIIISWSAIHLGRRERAAGKIVDNHKFVTRSTTKLTSTTTKRPQINSDQELNTSDDTNTGKISRFSNATTNIRADLILEEFVKNTTL